MDDETLVAGLKAREGQAQEIFWRRYWEVTYPIAAHILGHGPDAVDVAVEIGSRVRRAARGAGSRERCPPSGIGSRDRRAPSGVGSRDRRPLNLRWGPPAAIWARPISWRSI